MGCEQTGVKKEVSVSRQEAQIKPAVEEPKPVEAKAEAASGSPVKIEESWSHPKDKRTIQQIISEITGEKTGPDNSGSLYSSGLTATYTSPEEIIAW